MDSLLSISTEGSSKTVSGIASESQALDKMELISMMKPFIFKLDESVAATKQSQESLNKELDELLMVLEKIRSVETLTELDEETKIKYKLSGDIATDIEHKSRQLLGLKRRLTLVHSILQTINSRTKKLLLTHSSRINNRNLP